MFWGSTFFSQAFVGQAFFGVRTYCIGRNVAWICTKPYWLNVTQRELVCHRKIDNKIKWCLTIFRQLKKKVRFLIFQIFYWEDNVSPYGFVRSNEWWSEWGDRYTERKAWNFGKVPSSTEKGKDRKKPKEGEGDRFARDKKRKEKEKKETGQKRRRRRVQRRPEKGSISSFSSRSAILDPRSLRRKGQGGWNRFSVGERAASTQFFNGSAIIFPCSRQTAQHRKSRFWFFKFFIEKITFRHTASSDLMSDGRSEEIDIQKGRHGRRLG